MKFTQHRIALSPAELADKHNQYAAPLGRPLVSKRHAGRRCGRVLHALAEMMVEVGELVVCDCMSFAHLMETYERVGLVRIDRGDDWEEALRMSLQTMAVPS